MDYRQQEANQARIAWAATGGALPVDEGPFDVCAAHHQQLLGAVD